MKSATARSAKDPAGRCRTPASPRAQRGRGLPYLQAVGAWRRRLLVRLKEDLLAPPEELDNSDEDMVQHQDHARSRPPARPPAPPLRSVSASAIASLSPRDCPPGPRPGPPTPRPTATEPRPLPATLDSTSQLVRSSDSTRSPTKFHLPYLSALKSSISSAIRISAR